MYESDVELMVYEENWPVWLSIDLVIFEDEPNDNGKPSRPFWTYDIKKIRAQTRDRWGNLEDFELYPDFLESWGHEIREACVAEVNKFREAA